jgi:hypothetical protein
MYMPFGDDQKEPIGNRIIILYRNDRVLFGGDAVFDVIVTKGALFHFRFSSTDFAPEK